MERTLKIVIHVSKSEISKHLGESFVSDSYMNDVVNAMRERILEDFDRYLEDAVFEVNANFERGDFSGDFDGTGQLNNEIWEQIDDDDE